MLNKLTKGQPDWTDPLNENVDVIAAMHNRIYEGMDLTVLHAVEIQSAHGGNPWAWIQARIRAGNFEGILVGDFIPFTTIPGILFEMEIAGINTYKNYGENETVKVENHIDFISRDCHPDPFVFNRANYNNGTTVNASPYLASSIYARLNNLSQSTPSSTAAGGAPTNENFTATGLLNTLPQELRNVIVQKRNLLPTRFTAGNLLVDDNSWVWNNLGLLWLPFETEIYGHQFWSTRGREGGFVQYPLFANNMKRVKHAGKGGVRVNWWLASALGGNSADFCGVTSYGLASRRDASNATIRVPLCFRIA